MSRQLIINEEAEANISEAAFWYQKQRDGLGEEFLAEVRVSIDSAVSNPRGYRRLRRIPEVRRVLTRRFPYRIFFVVRPDAIIVFRVIHGSRHDREWKTKTPGK